MSGALGAIVHRLFDQNDHAPAPEVTPAAPLLTRLDDVDRQLRTLTQSIEHLQSTVPSERPDQPARAGDELTRADGHHDGAIIEALTTLERQIARAGREQLKANTLAEAQRDQVSAALEELRAAGARRETEIDMLREQVRPAQAAARLEMARSLLPALDGLDEALRSGRHVLERPAAPSPRRFGWLRGVRTPEAATLEVRRDMESWLVGIGYVRERLLATLAGEGIQPMVALGQPFDPQLHMAIEVTPATAGTPAGTVTAVIRQGYLAGDRVLRHAEVAVAKGEPDSGGTL